MTFAVAVDRVRAEFTDMPRMELTLPQAVRLWNLGADDCRAVLDALVDAGFLRWTTRRTIVRSGEKLSGRHSFLVHKSVLIERHRDKSVGMA